MPKKSKTVGLESTPSYGVGGYEDAKARLRHQSLMQDFQELQKEVVGMRSKLEAGKQRKLMLAAEARFLRRRYEYFMKMKCVDSFHKEKSVLKHAKNMKELCRKDVTTQHVLPPITGAKAKKKKQYIKKEVAPNGASPINQQHRKLLHGGKEAMQESLTLNSDLNHKGRIDMRRKTLVRNTAPLLDLNQKERLHTKEAALRNTFLAFDLNQDNSSSVKEASLPTRPPIFDLNEVSTGDEDFHSNSEAVNYEEAKRSLMRHPKEEMQNDLMLSVCRNAGEGPSRVGKRKISWLDPVALRV